nr:hypothetical protein [Stappia sp. TSB10GB4]
MGSAVGVLFEPVRAVLRPFAAMQRAAAVRIVLSRIMPDGSVSSAPTVRIIRPISPARSSRRFISPMAARPLFAAPVRRPLPGYCRIVAEETI